jgi:hypothetical protein
MTQISLTSGEILDLITLLSDKEFSVYEKDPMMSTYYLRIMQQFEDVHNKLQEFPGENRVANLIMAAN